MLVTVFDVGRSKSPTSLYEHTLGRDVGDLSVRTCHQHIWSQTSITNIVINNFEINNFNILVYF